MATITVYTFEDADENPDGFETQDWDEAEEYAKQNALLIFANEYEWTEAVPVGYDYRPDTFKVEVYADVEEDNDMLLFGTWTDQEQAEALAEELWQLPRIADVARRMRLWEHDVRPSARVKSVVLAKYGRSGARGDVVMEWGPEE